MTLARMYYKDTRPDAFLILHLYDGTVRGVLFRDHDAKVAALAEGRAAIDCTAITQGLLPHGAILVTRASASDAATLLEELREPGDTSKPDPLAAVRLAFSLRLLVKRSETIDKESDAQARLADPLAAWRYDSIVAALLDADVAGGTDDR